MRRPHLIAAMALGTLSVVLILVSLSYYIERPTVLRVAVAAGERDDVDLVNAMGKLAKHERKGLRIKPVPTDSLAEAGRAMERDEADLAIVRPDVVMPDKGGTVVLLHKNIALLVAPGGGPIEKIADLAGKRVGLVGTGAGDDKMFETALGQYDLAVEAVKTLPLKPEDVGEAIRQKTVDAIFVVGQVSSKAMQTAVRAVAKAGEGAPVFLPVSEAAAIAESQPAYESVEIVKGAFGGSPPRPADDIDTLGVTTRLVASADLSEQTVAALTRFLLSERVALTALAPAARWMAAPATDKGAVMPVHPGTAAYIDDEEETFLDQYSDFIYIGAMVLGVFASGLTAIVGRFGATASLPVEEFIGRLLAILKQVRAASRASVLEGCDAEVDAILTEALDRDTLKGLDERKAAALGMAVDQVRAAIHQRREVLARTGRAAANDDPPPAFEPILLTRLGAAGEVQGDR